LSQNDQSQDPRSPETLEQPGTEGEVFAEPWEAQVFALAVTLSSRGLYSWREWTETLRGELAQISGDTQALNGTRHYLHWLTALERIAVAKGIVDKQALAVRKRQWIEAYGSAPHGQPAELRS
jgi:nitrile hydratase accessory protein